MMPLMAGVLPIMPFTTRMFMRTTLNLEEDALIAAQTLARRRKLSLGQAVSELVRRGSAVPVIPPISIGRRSRTIMRPWPTAAWV